MNEADIPTSVPLTVTVSGEAVILTEIRAGDKLSKRLGELGLHVGMQVRVVRSDGTGTMILAVQNDCRLAIGRGMAQKIMVQRLQGDA